MNQTETYVYLCRVMLLSYSVIKCRHLSDWDWKVENVTGTQNMRGGISTTVRQGARYCATKIDIHHATDKESTTVRQGQIYTTRETRRALLRDKDRQTQRERQGEHCCATKTDRRNVKDKESNTVRQGQIYTTRKTRRVLVFEKKDIITAKLVTSTFRKRKLRLQL